MTSRIPNHVPKASLPKSTLEDRVLTYGFERVISMQFTVKSNLNNNKI